MTITFNKTLSRLLSATALTVAGALATVTPAVAQQCASEDNERGSKTLSAATAKVLGPAYEALQAENYAEALSLVDGLIASRGDRMDAFEKSTVYEIRGSINAGRENFRAALSDFQTALSAGGLPTARNNTLRYFIAQLNFQEERYKEAIDSLNSWIAYAQRCGEPIDANAYYLLAAANVQKTPQDFRAALSPAEKVIDLRPEPRKSDYDLLNLVYSELNENSKRAALLEKMINIWPGERSYWAQLGGLYSTIGQDANAFSVIEVAYRAGLLDKEAEILTLVNFYSFFDNPYRGAKLLEKELAAGRVKNTQQNQILLTQLWSQARESKRAIPVLTTAAANSSDGELSYRLGQQLLADEQYVPAIRALTQAINKGGLDARQTGDVWMLLGTARFNAADQDDCAARLRARSAFTNATRYSTSASQARSWVGYIDAINQTLFDQDKLENVQNIDATQAQLERLKTEAQVCRLQGTSSANCGTVEQRTQQAQTRLAELQRSDAVTKCGARPVTEDEAQAADASGDGASSAGEAAESETADG